MIDWIIVGVIAVIIIAILIKKFKDIKAGKVGCGCGCSGCPSRGRCQQEKNQRDEL